MTVSRWVLASLLAALPVSTAVAAGPEAAMERPETKRKTYRTKDLKEALGATVALPETLVAWRADRTGKTWGPRYFDASGRVFTAGQVRLIVGAAADAGACDACLPHLAEHDLHAAVSHALTLAQGASGGQLGLALLGQQLHHGTMASKALGRAVDAFSGR